MFNAFTISSLLITSLLSLSNCVFECDYKTKDAFNKNSIVENSENRTTKHNLLSNSNDSYDVEINVYDAFSNKYQELINLLNACESGTVEYQNTEKLCNFTYDCLSRCNPEQTTSLNEIASFAQSNTPLSNRSIDDPVVIGALAWFSSHNYDLSYELLAHAFDEEVEQSPNYYVPVHGYRIFQSDLIYLIANEPYTNENDFISHHPELVGTFLTGTNGSLFFPLIGNNYEKDLRYAIQAFKFTKPYSSSKTVTIYDTYDFEENNNYSGLEGEIINYLYSLQLNGVLKTYDLNITYDFSHFLRLKTISKNNSTWTIEVKNPNSTKVDFIYNKKMCHFDDAKNWTNLTDVSYGTVLGNSTTIVSISENLFATSVSFSFFSGSYKYMIFGDGLDTEGKLDFRINKKAQSYNSRIRLMGKDGTKWLLKIKNTTSYRALLEYNTKMCFHTDAQNWTGLLDLTDLYLEPNEMRYIYISENGTATSIALTFSNTNTQCSYYANNLNTNGTMSLSSSYRSSRIRIENRGKSGTTWNIRVKNPTNHNITVYYNCKMCFENDAKNWTSIGNNERSVVITPTQKYADIQISENWFATHITISYVVGSTRHITYANELNANKSIHMYWNTVSV